MAGRHRLKLSEGGEQIRQWLLKIRGRTLKLGEKLGEAIFIAVCVALVLAIFGKGIAVLDERNSRKADDQIDQEVIPAEVVVEGWEKWASRFSEDDVPVENILGDTNVRSSSPNAIGMPVAYAGQFQYPSHGWPHHDLAAQSNFTFTLQGKTSRPVIVTSIRAVIKSNEEFSPKTFYFVLPQADTPRAEFGVDLGGADLEAKQMDHSSVTDKGYLRANGSFLSIAEPTPYSVSVVAPPGRKISFHLEFQFHGYEEPVRVDNNGSPLIAVGYPTEASPPLHAYMDSSQLPPYTHGLGPLKCDWQVDCLSSGPTG